jgi:uncharacterized membrane protein YraQ (UPF0718 family)
MNVEPHFFESWARAAATSAGFFWMALWAFVLGYVISSLIQVMVTPAAMRRAMGDAGPRSVALGTFFGFLSSSCSFSALATTRALFQKGAGLAASLAFLLASTNLVIELGIVIAIFLTWQFVVGEYVGGILLVLIVWLLVHLTRPAGLVASARERVADAMVHDEDELDDWRDALTTVRGWEKIGRIYTGEWQMVWKDVLIGFTVAGVIAAFVPDAFFRSLFVGSGGPNAADPGLAAVLQQTVVGPVAAFFTFIGSMGNIPLAALLFDKGVSFAGVMAFIFSDLVVLPVLRINASYYGWKMALYMLGLLLVGLVITAVTLHYGLAMFDLLPEPGSGRLAAERNPFGFNYTTVLNALFLLTTAGLGWMSWRGRMSGGHEHDHGSPSLSDRVLTVVAVAAAAWLIAGWALALWIV